jgi:hypothetical protein
MYKTTPITKEEFLTFENSDRVEIWFSTRKMI